MLPALTARSCRPPAALLLLLAAVALPVRLIAQQSREVRPGSTVLLELGDRRQERGTLLGRAGNDVLLWKSPSDTARIPFSEVIRSSAYEGSTPRGWSAVGKGAAVGTGFGLMLGALALSHTGDARHESGAGFAVVAIGTLILGGTLVGGALAVLPEEHWTEFDPATIGSVATNGRS